MVRKGFVRKLKPLEMLTEEQIEEVHRATLEVLREPGVRLEDRGALDFLKKNGCAVEESSMRARFPEALVEECLRQVPSTYQVKAPNPDNDLVYGGDIVYYSHTSGMHTIDLDTFETRPPTKAEYVECVRVLDALPTLDHLLGLLPVFWV